MNIDDEFLLEIAMNTSSLAEAIKIAIQKNESLSEKEIKEKFKELDLDTSHWNKRGPNKVKRGTSLREICVENSWYTSKTKLKERLVKEKILDNKCSECGVGPWWNYKPLVLQMDHINGNNRDHRIENLRILCGNCHSQTITYAGSNKKKNHS